MRLLSYRLPVKDASNTGEARRLAVAAATDLKFSSTQQGRIAIVASELATNLAKHSPTGGEFVVQEIKCGSKVGLELMTIDSGPGFADLGTVMRDGYSSAGSAGTGLGAVRRLSSSFDVYSQQGSGSVFVAQIWSDESASKPCDLEYGVVSVPYPGETFNGDGWLIDELGGGLHVVLVIDGLGHGTSAHDAALAAIEAYGKVRGPDIKHIVEFCHGALRSTRGAAMAVALIDTDKRLVRYAGIGNIAAAIVSDTGVRRMISHDGTIGHVVRKVQEFSYPWPEGALLIMHSDGLTAHWNLEKYAGLLMRQPSIIAGVLYRDCKRKNDDATVVVAREI